MTAQWIDSWWVFLIAFALIIAGGVAGYYGIMILCRRIDKRLGDGWIEDWRAERKRIRGRRGFTLVEMAVVVMIAGLLLAAATQLLVPYAEQARGNESAKKMELVLQSVASFAARNNRIPCPAKTTRSAGPEPFGAERGSGSSGTGMGSCNPSQNVGIVPFRTLGLAEDDVKDGWGNFLTYAVSVAFAKDPSSGQAHALCRKQNVWVDIGDPLDPADDENLNPEKARFCCVSPAGAGPGTDLVVNDAGGSPIWPFSRDGSNYDDVDVPATAPPGNVTVPVVLVVSHGKNGFGGYLVDAGGQSSTGSPGNDEQENADGDQTFVDAPRDATTGSSYYDDIVKWRTQDRLMSDIGRANCALP